MRSTASRAPGSLHREALGADTFADEARFFSARRTRRAGGERFGLLLSAIALARLSASFANRACRTVPGGAPFGNRALVREKSAMASDHHHHHEPRIVRATALPERGQRPRLARDHGEPRGRPARER